MVSDQCSTCLGRVGGVFAVEASRLARNGHDWHRLLEFCRIVDALIVDHDGIYGSEASERQAGSRAEGDDERSRAVDVPATLARGDPAKGAARGITRSKSRFAAWTTPRQCGKKHESFFDSFSLAIRWSAR